MAKLNHFWKWQIGRFLIFWCLKRGRWKNLAFHDVAQGLAPVLLLNHAFKECLWVVLKCLKTSASVCWCLFKSFLSFGVWRGASIDMDDILGCQRCLRVFLETYSMRDSVRLEPTHHLAQPWKARLVFIWLFWDIKISKPPYLPFPKMAEFCHFSYFSCLPEKNYNLQSLWITL